MSLDLLTKRRKNLIWVIFCLIIGGACFCQEEEKTTPQYIGGYRCGVCHRGEGKNFIYERWTISGHARAYDNLPSEARALPVCLGCHTTGYWEHDKWYQELAPDDLRGVQCEACHGPGSLYRKPCIMNQQLQAQDPGEARRQKIAAGLLLPTLADCKTKCHNEKCPQYKPLVLEKSLKEVVHPYPQLKRLLR